MEWPFQGPRAVIKPWNREVNLLLTFYPDNPGQQFSVEAQVWQEFL